VGWLHLEKEKKTADIPIGVGGGEEKEEEKEKQRKKLYCLLFSLSSRSLSTSRRLQREERGTSILAEFIHLKYLIHVLRSTRQRSLPFEPFEPFLFLYVRAVCFLPTT